MLKIQQTTAAPVAKENLTWHNITADELPTKALELFEAMVTAETKWKAELEKAFIASGDMTKDQRLVISRKGRSLGIAFAKSGAKASGLKLVG